MDNINPTQKSNTALKLACIILIIFTKVDNYSSLSQKEGMAIVTLGWISAGFFGSLPFLLSGYIGNITDAYFESISGFTLYTASDVPK